MAAQPGSLTTKAGAWRTGGSAASGSRGRSLRRETLRVRLGGPRALAWALLAALLGQGGGSAARIYGPNFGGMPAGALGGGEAQESFMDMMRMAADRRQGLREVVPRFAHNRMEMMFPEDDDEELGEEPAGPMTFGTLDEVQEFMRKGGSRQDLLLGLAEPGPVHAEGGRSGAPSRGAGAMGDNEAMPDVTSSGTRDRGQHLLGRWGEEEHAQYLGGLGAVRGGGRSGGWGASEIFDAAPRGRQEPHKTIRETWAGFHDEQELLGFGPPGQKRVLVAGKEKHPRLRAEVKYRGDADDYYGLTSPGSDSALEGAPPVKRRLLFDDMIVDNGGMDSRDSGAEGQQGLSEGLQGGAFAEA